MTLLGPLSFRIFASVEPPDEELEGRRFKAPVGLRFDDRVDEAGPSNASGRRPSRSACGNSSSRSYSLCLFLRGGYRDVLLWNGRMEDLSWRGREMRGRKDDLDAMVVLFFVFSARCNHGFAVGLFVASAFASCRGRLAWLGSTGTLMAELIAHLMTWKRSGDDDST